MKDALESWRSSDGSGVKGGDSLPPPLSSKVLSHSLPRVHGHQPLTDTRRGLTGGRHRWVSWYPRYKASLLHRDQVEKDGCRRRMWTHSADPLDPEHLKSLHSTHPSAPFPR